MALRQILAKRQMVTNSRGQPLAAGLVHVYEPNTQTNISAYGDSGLVQQLTNPVRLSGSGRAEIWVSRDCDIRITDRNGNLVVEELSANPDELGGEDSGGLVPNGSFEIDTDADGVPDGWTLTDETGSSNAIDATQSTDGDQCFRFTGVGTGGGTLETTDFFPANGADDLRVNFDLRSTVAGVRNVVSVRWHDSSAAFISATTIYDSTANPTSFATSQLLATPPGTARFAKLRIVGCDPTVAVAGSTYVDRVNVFYPAVVPGIFGNLEMLDNQIRSNNLNGNIDLNPNGTGLVRRGTNTIIDVGNMATLIAISASQVTSGLLAIARGGTNAASAADARTQLGLGTAAVEADSKYNHRANNLSDVANATTARGNLGAAASSHAHAFGDLSGVAAASHAHAAADVTSGQFADARVAATNVTQHVASINHNALLNYVANRHRLVSQQNGGSASGGADTDVILIW